MTAFTVWKFETPDGAAASVPILKSAASDGLVKIIDHAVVSWPTGASRPDISHGHEATKRGTGWGAFWGLLLGSLFLMPVLGAAAGAAVGRLHSGMEGVGITDDQLQTIRDQVTEGTSALFLVTEEGNLDRLGERFHGWEGRLVTTNLTAEERGLLLETFGDSPVTHRTTS
jgi:uncharacterized membrane protein